VQPFGVLATRRDQHGRAGLAPGALLVSLAAGGSDSKDLSRTVEALIGRAG